jgi:hypothetical protein
MVAGRSRANSSTARSASYFERPYQEIGFSGSLSLRGVVPLAGPAAAWLETKRKRFNVPAAYARAALRRLMVPSLLTALNVSSSGTRSAAAQW